ncbi:MAG: hypothetical protein HOW73_03510 [Polyangiaceae bacterium]|nr:hypothetical protein [Polyangiaceae bacterium]
MTQGAPPLERGTPPRVSLGQELALLSALKLTVSAALLVTGFQGISDDDFARVVIAQDFAHAPKLDPSGTSWLPFPFWLNGLVMMLFGGSLAVARAVAIALGVASVLLVRLAAQWMTGDRVTAFAAAALAAVLPWSVRLGVSTVPELPTAALTLVAIASLSPSATAKSAGRPLFGALALFAATLSRYEPWFVAIGFVAILVYESIRERQLPALRAAAMGIAIAGPVVWSLWNHHAHGYALHYLDRVAAYKQAVDQGAVAARIFDYVFAVFRAEPELLLVLGYLVFRWWKGGRSQRPSPFAAFGRAALILGFVFVTLTLSSVKGGAPTHHAERALLVVHLTAVVLCAALFVHAIRHKNLGSPHILFALVLAVVPGLYILRSWFLYKETFAKRHDEVHVGEEVARAVPADERVLVEVVDYGFFAVEAGAARPWSFEMSSPIHPATGAEKLSLEALADRARAKDIHYLTAVAGGEAPGVAKIVCHGWWCLYAIEDRP